MGSDELRCDEEDCDFVAKSKARLKEHSFSHSKDKQTCGECGKDFAGVRSLRVHEGRIHKKKDVNSTESVQNAQVGLVEEEEDLSQHMPVTSSSKKSLISIKKVQSKEIVKDATPSKPKPATPKLKKGKRKSAKLLVKDVNGKTTTEKVAGGSEPEIPAGLESEAPTKSEVWRVPCHCPQCVPCSNLCCENPPVRAGQCCDPRTLGSCLQPYQPQCFAPCCERSVFLQSNHRYLGGSLELREPWLLAPPQFSLLGQEERGEAEFLLYQDALSEATQLQLTLSYFEPAGTLSDDEEEVEEEEEEDESGLLSSQPPASPVAVRSPESRGSPGDSRYTYRFTKEKESSLLAGCRIVLAFRNNKQLVFYRSSCGQYFKSKDKLISFMKSKHPEKAEEEISGFSTFKETWVGVSSGHVDKVVKEETESSSQSGVSDSVITPATQGPIIPVKSETIYISCPHCKEEIQKKEFNKHYLTHRIKGAKVKLVEVNSPTISNGEVSKYPGGPKVQGKEKIPEEEETAEEVSSDFLNVTCPLPVASSSSEKEKQGNGEKSSVKSKRSRSISAIEKSKGPKKVRKTNVEDSPGPSLATNGSTKKEPAKRGRKKKTN